ncbi:MAG: YkgJ family cysteine cluster protein [Phycisphaerae bacterium]|nr:YkgJ family cysteine cluster protein [Phycisphaerae bacterium]
MSASSERSSAASSPSSPPSSPASADTPWYSAGIAFSCAQCGNCCSGAPGYVWVTLQEAGQIADALSLKLSDFTRRYTRRVGSRLSLIELKGGDCVFLVRTPDGLTNCKVHDVRPVQCRTWPFWQSNLSSPKAWERAGRGCPGMNHGRIHPLPTIRTCLSANADLPL